MKASDFLEEVKSSPLCPPDFEEQYRYFCRYQNMVIDALSEFHRVCEKNAVNYHVTFGSLLGIIRDGGTIPWDYDIDVFVPVSQKNELISALRRDLSDTFYAMCPEMDETCRHYIVRICPKGYNSAAVHLDVFYYCGAPDDETERKLFNNRLRRCSRIRFSKMVNIKEESVASLKRMLKLTAAKIVYSVFNLKRTDEYYKQLICKYPIPKSQYVVSADFCANDYLIPTEMLNNTILFDSGLGEVRIPKDYKGFLKMVYGRFTEYPPLGDRIRQVTSAVRRFRHFEKLG